MIRVAISFPTAWPQVRRGGQRLLHETTAVLNRNWLDALAIGSWPEIAGEAIQEAVRYRLLRQGGGFPPSPQASGGAFPRFALSLRCQLLSEPFDAVVCLHRPDAAAAAVARLRAGRNFRVLFHCVEIRLARARRVRTPPNAGPRPGPGVRRAVPCRRPLHELGRARAPSLCSGFRPGPDAVPP